MARRLLGDDAVDGFDHPRDRTFYLAALRALGAVGPDDQPTEVLGRLADPDPEAARAAFLDALEQSELGRTWMAWAGTNSLVAVAPESAQRMLTQRSDLAPSPGSRTEGPPSI